METAQLATMCNLWGNPTEPKLQGLLEEQSLVVFLNIKHNAFVYIILRGNMKEDSSSNNKNKKKRLKISWAWPIKVLCLTLVLSFVLNVSSEALSSLGLIVNVVILFVFVVASIIFDMIGVAVTASSLEPLLAMASRKEKGSKEAIKLVKNAEKISSVCCDIIGDCCGILSGAVGANLVVSIYSVSGDLTSVLIAGAVSCIVAGMTVFGKAVCKSVAVNYSTEIVLKVGKFINFFSFKKKNK